MKHANLHRAVSAAIAMGLVLSLTGCGAALEAVRRLEKDREPTGEDFLREETFGEQMPPDALPEELLWQEEDPSYLWFQNDLRECDRMAGIAFLGYVSSSMTTEEYIGLLQRRGYLEGYAFLAQIPEERIVRNEGGHILFCLVPADPDGSVTVTQWSVENYSTLDGQPGEVLYSGDSQSPLLLICGDEETLPNLQVRLEDSAGNVNIWYPRINSVMDAMVVASSNEEQLHDFSLEHKLTAKTQGSWEKAMPEVLHGDWIAWEAHTAAGDPLMCSLSFYQDEAGKERVEYFYGPPMGEIYARYEGTLALSAQPMGFITEDMCEIHMKLVGGAALEGGLPPRYDGEEPPEFISGVYNIDYYPDTDVIEISHQFVDPLLDGIASIVFERSVG